jgi:hypothetical protein
MEIEVRPACDAALASVHLEISMAEVNLGLV